MALLGYARVSTNEQDEALQLDALSAAGCTRIFTDHVTGIAADRPELARVLDHLRDGDTLVAWKLDRIGRSLPHLIELAELLRDRGAGLRVLDLGDLDTSTAAGALLLEVFGALSQFERRLMIERTHAGLAAARVRGRVGGRPAVMTPAKLDVARNLLAAGELTATQVAETVGVSRATLYRHLRGAAA